MTDRTTKGKIIDALAHAQDEGLKGVLLLMLHAIEEISEKIDAVLADEQRLRSVVLDEYQDVHHLHHAWIAGRMAEEDEAQRDHRAGRRRMLYGLVEKALWAALVAVAAAGWIWR